MPKMGTLTINGVQFEIEDDGTVRFDESQNLTPEQKARALANIGAIAEPSLNGHVYFRRASLDGIGSLNFEKHGFPTMTMDYDASGITQDGGTPALRIGEKVLNEGSLPVILRGVAPGEDDNDAVNVDQLYSALNDKIMIVDCDGTTADRTGEEIWNHIDSGGIAVLRAEGEYYPFLYSCGSDDVAFGYAHAGYSSVMTWTIDREGNAVCHMSDIIDETLVESIVDSKMQSLTAKMRLVNGSSNIYREEDYTLGYVANTGGTPASSTGLKYSIPIPVQNGDIIRCYNKNGNALEPRDMRFVAAFNTSGAILPYHGAAQVKEYTVPTEADGSTLVAYVIITLTASITGHHITINQVPEKYEPYSEEKYYVATPDFVGIASENKFGLVKMWTTEVDGETVLNISTEV